MYRLISVCSVMVLCLAAAAYAGPGKQSVEQQIETAKGAGTVHVIRPKAAEKQFVCLSGEQCVRKDSRDDSKKPAFLKKAGKPICMAVRGTGAYCTADGLCYDEQGKSDGVNYKEKAKQERAGRKIGIPVPLVAAKAHGFSSLTIPLSNAVAGVRGFVPSVPVAEGHSAGYGVGVRGYAASEKEGKPAPRIMLDLDEAAFVVVLNVVEASASVYINDQYYGNVGGGVYATYLVPSGELNVSIVSESGDEMSDTASVPAGELVYYMVGPYEESPKEGEKGYGGFSQEAWRPSWMPQRCATVICVGRAE